MKLPNSKKINKLQVLILASVSGLIFSAWGLWDLSYWISAYPGQDFPFPFNVVRIPWFIAGDFFTVAIATFGTILGIIALERTRAKDDEANADRELILENIKAFRELVQQLKKHRTTKKDKS